MPITVDTVNLFIARFIPQKKNVEYRSRRNLVCDITIEVSTRFEMNYFYCAWNIAVDGASFEIKVELNILLNTKPQERNLPLYNNLKLTEYTANFSNDFQNF